MTFPSLKPTIGAVLMEALYWSSPGFFYIAELAFTCQNTRDDRTRMSSKVLRIGSADSDMVFRVFVCLLTLLGSFAVSPSAMDFARASGSDGTLGALTAAASATSAAIYCWSNHVAPPLAAVLPSSLLVLFNLELSARVLDIAESRSSMTFTKMM